MKPAAFEYLAPRSLDETFAALDHFGEDAKVLAGGQSLVATMNFRLARPSALVDIGHLTDLVGLDVGEHAVEIGALTSHRRLELGGDVGGPLGRLLSQAGHLVGHLPIRTRGTFGGSIAHADPASEWCVLAALLDATVLATSPRGTREIAASEHFITVFTTALEPDEVIAGVRLPLLGPDHRAGFAEFSRRAGDFAIVMAMSSFRLRDGAIDDPRIALGGVADRPVRVAAAEEILQGAAPGPAAFEEAAQAASTSVDPHGDLQGPPEFRRDLVRAMTRRALEQSLLAES
ncbi:MAG: FAD binding domain-containing protein [Acidimicrobiales bacterium]|nr:FAD binding domain-containing protein [Acidimicrobiales bacterium]